MPPQNQRGLPEPRYVDRPDVCETFADSLHNITFDGATMRLEFTVFRWGEIKPPARPTRRAYTSCRVVLSREGAIDLLNKITRLGDGLAQQGVLSREPVEIDPVTVN